MLGQAAGAAAGAKNAGKSGVAVAVDNERVRAVGDGTAFSEAPGVNGYSDGGREGHRTRTHAQSLARGTRIGETSVPRLRIRDTQRCGRSGGVVERGAGLDGEPAGGRGAHESSSASEIQGAVSQFHTARKVVDGTSSFGLEGHGTRVGAGAEGDQCRSANAGVKAENQQLSGGGDSGLGSSADGNIGRDRRVGVSRNAAASNRQDIGGAAVDRVTSIIEDNAAGGKGGPQRNRISAVGTGARRWRCSRRSMQRLTLR